MKRLVFLLIAFLFLLTYASHNALSTQKTLYVYMWSNYIDPKCLEEFQRDNNCLVIVDTYDSNEAMYTKLLLGASGYDIVFPSNYILELMQSRGMLLEITQELIPNSRFIDTQFLHNSLHLEETRYGLPYMATFAGIAWRKDRIHPNPLSWDLFSSPNLRGRATLLNDMRETLGIALKFLGYSANSHRAEEIQRAKQHVITSWRPHLAKFESEQYKNGIANGEYLAVHGFSGDCLQVMSENGNIEFDYPKEGIVAAVDYAAIMASSERKGLAHAFLNFLFETKIAQQNVRHTYSRSLQRQVREGLPERLRTSPLLYPEDTPSIKIECIRSVGEAQKEYASAWNDIKAGRL